MQGAIGVSAVSALTVLTPLFWKGHVQVSRLRIFETDPDALPKTMQFESDIVGKFRSGKLQGRTPVSLTTWRITTGDPNVAETVARRFGGEVAEWETSGEDSLEVITDTDAVAVIIDGPDAIEADLKLWGLNGTLIHHCDGVEFLDDERRGQPCGCPQLLAERRAAAKAGHGPRPDVRITFRLHEEPQLGRFRLSSGSWDLVRDLHQYLTALDQVGGPAVCTLRLARVSFTPKAGPMAGREVSYQKPALTVHRAYDAAETPAGVSAAA